MTTFRRNLALSLAIASIACTSLCSADTVVSNIGGDASRYQIGGGLANSFTTGTSDALLNSVTLYFKVNSPDTSFLVNICSNNAGTIGNTVCSTTLTDATTGIQSLTFSGFTGDTRLSASTTYWLTISAVGNTNSISGWFDNPSASTSDYGWQINSSRLYYSSGAWWTTIQTGQEEFSIDATVVPEPGTYAALLGLSAFGLVMVARRKR